MSGSVHFVLFLWQMAHDVLAKNKLKYITHKVSNLQRPIKVTRGVFIASEPDYMFNYRDLYKN